MSTRPTPTIELSVQRVTCPRHGEPFRARWPKGWPRFTLAVIRALLEEPTFAETLGGDIAAVNAALDVRPACERVSPDVLRAAYRDCGIGTRARCVVCRRRDRVGTPYSRRVGGQTVDDAHVCFDCVLTRMSPIS